jgi:hypothetical protein
MLNPVPPSREQSPHVPASPASSTHSMLEEPSHARVPVDATTTRSQTPDLTSVARDTTLQQQVGPSSFPPRSSSCQLSSPPAPEKADQQEGLDPEASNYLSIISGPPSRSTFIGFTHNLAAIESDPRSDWMITCSVKTRDEEPPWGRVNKRGTSIGEPMLDLTWNWEMVPVELCSQKRKEHVEKTRYGCNSLKVTLCLPSSVLTESSTDLEAYTTFSEMILGKARCGLRSQCFRRDTRKTWFHPEEFKKVETSLAAFMIKVAIESYNRPEDADTVMADGDADSETESDDTDEVK